MRELPYINGIMQYLSFGAWLYFTPHSAFKIHPCAYALTFVSYLLFHSSVCGHLVWFHLLTVGNDALAIGIQITLRPVCNSFWYLNGWILRESLQTISTIVPFHIPPTREQTFLTSSWRLAIFLVNLFYFKRTWGRSLNASQPCFTMCLIVFVSYCLLFQMSPCWEREISGYHIT